MELDELTDLTVTEQEDELENLSKTKLEDLREKETRQTAIDNIDSELSDRQEESRSEDLVEEDSEAPDVVKENFTEEEVAELQSKVDYLIKRCKTTSHEGFENYSDNQ